MLAIIDGGVGETGEGGIDDEDEDMDILSPDAVETVTEPAVTVLMKEEG